jgi:hypothetical protein
LIHEATSDRKKRRWNFKQEAILMNDNDNGIEYDDNEIEDNDDKIEENDSIHEEDKTATKGAPLVKKKHGRTVDHKTVFANQLDAELLPTTTPEQERTEVRRGKTAEDDEEKESDLRKDSAIVKQKNKERLEAAKKGFDFNLLKPPKAANDNYRTVVSWPLMDQLTRPTFEPDEELRNNFISAARYLRGLIDLVNAEPLGDETDCGVQRTESGRVHFENGMTLDRRKWKNDDGEVRHVGSARIAKNSIPIGNRINRNDPFPVRQLAAREDLNEIIVAVGPLWPSLLAALAEDATMTEIGLNLGAKGAAAPPLGVRTIKLALAAAIDALAVRKDVSRVITPLPDKSRGSFYNQTRGLYSGSNHVVKVA